MFDSLYINGNDRIWCTNSLCRDKCLDLCEYLNNEKKNVKTLNDYIFSCPFSEQLDITKLRYLAFVVHGLVDSENSCVLF